MASSPLRAPVGQPQSRLLDMKKKFQQRHLATVAAVKDANSTSSNTKTMSSTVVNNVVDGVQPVPPARRFGVSPQQSQRRSGGPGPGDKDSVLQVDVKGKVRQMFAQRNQQQHLVGPGYQHHQQQIQQQQQQSQWRQRRRSLTGRDRSRPLKPLSDANDDPLCKTVCFTAPSMAGGADIVGIRNADGDVRGELLALFGRLPNLGGQLLSDSFRKGGGGGGKMKTAQSAPELKWLLDGGPGPPTSVAAAGGGPEQGKGAAASATGDGDDDVDDQLQQQQQIQMRPTTGRISSSSISNSKTAATMTKKPLAAVNGNGATGPVGGVVRGVKKLSVSNNDEAYRSPGTAAASVNGNRLLLPPVVQPTVINALASGESATDAVASVRAAAAAAGMQRPVVRASRLPPATRQQMPAAQVRQRVPSQQPSKAVPPSRPPAPAAAARVPPTASNVTRQPKKQLSENRGPPAKGMARCPLCARDFAADRLPKHEEVCRRTRERDRKRKVFDTSRKRLEAVAAEAGVDVMSFKKKSQKEDQRVAEKLQKKKDAWRRKHDALVRNVRAARAVQRHLAAGGSVRDLPPELDKVGPEQEDEADSDLVKCPHCARTFNEASAERHIPLCADRQRNAAARLRNKKR